MTRTLFLSDSDSFAYKHGRDIGLHAIEGCYNYTIDRASTTVKIAVAGLTADLGATIVGATLGVRSTMCFSKQR